MCGMVSPPPPPDKSPALTLSPLSSQFAAAAERDSIRHLKLECRGLSTALKSLKRNSIEWVAIKSRLEIASEELACMLEDRNLFRSFTGGDAPELDVEDEDRLSPIPTPPLGRNKMSASQECASLSALIPTPPLVSKPRRKSPDDAGNHAKFVAAISKPPLTVANLINASDESKEEGGELISNQNESKETQRDAHIQKYSLQKSQKYSLEWFQRKMDEAASKDSITVPRRHLPARSSAPDLSKASGNSNRASSQRNRTSRPRQSEFAHSMRLTCREVDQTRGGRDGPILVKDLAAKLKTVPKYSLEWFTIKKDIAAMESEDQFNHKVDANVHSKSPNHQELNEYIKFTKNSQNANPRSRPKDSINGPNECAEPEVSSLTERLDMIPKYSLDWFQIKQEIEQMKRERRNSNDFKRSLNVSKEPQSKNGKSDKAETKGQSSPRAKSKSKINAKMTRGRKLDLPD